MREKPFRVEINDYFAYEIVNGLQFVDETSPFDLQEPPSRISQVEIIYDCRVKIDDEIVAEKLVNQFKTYEQKTGTICKFNAGLEWPR